MNKKAVSGPSFPSNDLLVSEARPQEVEPAHEVKPTIAPPAGTPPPKEAAPPPGAGAPPEEAEPPAGEARPPTGTPPPMTDSSGGGGGGGGVPPPDWAKVQHILKKAAMDAQLLIAHLARSGAETKQDLEIETVLALSEKILAAPHGTLIPNAEQCQFWRGYSKLAEAAQPARVDALYYKFYAQSLGINDKSHHYHWWQMLSQNSDNSTPIDTHVKIHRGIQILAIITFVMTLFLASYLAVTENILASTQRLVEEYYTIALGRAPEASPLRQFANSNGDLGDFLRQPAAPAEGANRLGTAFDPRELIEARREDIREALKANYDRLDTLDWFVSIEQVEVPEPTTKLIGFDNNIRSMQREVNGVISTYLMPLFASILGVCVFFLRDTARKFSDLSFSASDVPSYLPRIILAVVGGLVFSWFVKPGDDPSVVASISPTAGAFLVGYSVELLFSTLDSIIKRLRGDQEKPPPQPAKG